MEKLNKATVLYVFNPPSKYTCEECAFIKKGKCSNFVTSDEDVKPYGSCNDWRTAEYGTIEGTHDRTRNQTGYAENKAGFSCKRCGEYVPDTLHCKKVDETGGLTPGKIHPNACCNRWEKSDLRGNLTDNEFKNCKWYNKNSGSPKTD